MRAAFAVVALGTCVALGAAIEACGGSKTSVTSGDAGGDATLADATPTDGTTTDSMLGNGDGAAGNDGAGGDSGVGGNDGGNPGCLNLGGACLVAGDCCSGVCNGGVCSYPPCTSDNQACVTNGQCCGGTCSGNACTPLPSSGCGKTLGNACTLNTDCCSSLCLNGVCAVSSFCGQNGDVCQSGADCCGGICTIDTDAGATKGICSQPQGGGANCTAVDGTVCGGVAADGGVILDEAGLPSCGGACCSRLCAPYGPTNVFVCQPASGCHVVGDLCRVDTDCCGSIGSPTIPQGGPVTCSITPPNTVGVCQNPNGCKPNGDVCKLPTSSCNASCDCCAGMAGGGMSKCDTDCRQDSLGVPRCTGPQCLDAGSSCGSSADCCNGAPCVPNPSFTDGGTPFVCYGQQCVPKCGTCSTTADCCPGETCVLPQASSMGFCGPCFNGNDGGAGNDGGGPSDGGAGNDGSAVDGGSPVDSGPPPCSLLGQECTTNANCCNGVPCSYFNSACAAGDIGCTCHFTIQ